MSSFKTEVDDRVVQAALTRLAESGRDMSAPMRAVARALRNITEDAFQKQASPFGPAWAALKKSTLKGRRGGGSGAKILQDTGQLAASISSSSDATSATVTAGKRYAAIHQFGGTIERPAYSTKTRHRTDRKGNLLRTGQFGGKGLIFAKDSHKSVLERWHEVNGFSIDIPARPFMPVDRAGRLAPVAQEAVITILQEALLGRG
jgi:phage virion morphogenesis protein